MDGAISTSNRHAVRASNQLLPSGSLGDTQSNSQAGLFDQLLSLSFGPTSDPLSVKSHRAPDHTHDSVKPSNRSSSSSEKKEEDEVEDADGAATWVANVSASPLVDEAPLAAVETIAVSLSDDSAPQLDSDAVPLLPNALDSAEVLPADSEVVPSSLATDSADASSTEEGAESARLPVQEISGDSEEQHSNQKPSESAFETSANAATHAVASQQGTEAAEQESEETALGEEGAESTTESVQELESNRSQQEGNERGKWYERDPKAPSTNLPLAEGEIAQPGTPDGASPAQPSTVESAVNATAPVGDRQPSDPAALPSVSSTTASTNAASIAANAATASPNLLDSIVVGVNRGSDASMVTQLTGDSAGAPTSSSVSSGSPTTSTTQGSPNKESAATPTAPEGNSPEVTQQERVRLIQRVSRSFSRLGPSGGEINLRLHPPQLGSLNVQVRLQGRSMTAKLTTESAASRDVILEGLPVLRQRLAEQGFDISQFQVEVADNESNQALGPHSDGQSFTDQNEHQSRQGQLQATAAWRSSSSPILADGSSGDAATSLSWQSTTGIDFHA
ncbi:flagellar hook-length control protein FliK [Aureliella helgolandensis]|uniref:Flagellar hook-length control protein FliK n=1 Tax=Aureliella helgolandensis TaxID=2527968 RepID=A0A518GEU4_9BACT|nr:flagellar hook-length control protein FliK [Aureliella helgolandensis]QDV27124.1 Flagellar hook-length control protein FliK [Aureliella helgolandensis]